MRRRRRAQPLDEGLRASARSALRLALSGAGACLVGIALLYPAWVLFVNGMGAPAAVGHPDARLAMPAAQDVGGAVLTGLGLLALSRLS